MGATDTEVDPVSWSASRSLPLQVLIRYAHCRMLSTGINILFAEQVQILRSVTFG